MIAGIIASGLGKPPVPSTFVKELTNAEFTTYANIATLSGIGSGTLIYEGSGWLEFLVDSITLIIPKKNVRHTVSWNILNTAGCVFGTKIVTIGGKQYKVRLLKGADTDPGVNQIGNYITGTNDSEWSKLFYPLVRDDTNVPIPPRNASGPYTQADLQMAIAPYSLCQEVHGAGTNMRVCRGFSAVSFYTYTTFDSADLSRGWRPCLELIP